MERPFGDGGETGVAVAIDRNMALAWRLGGDLFGRGNLDAADEILAEAGRLRGRAPRRPGTDAR